MKARDAAVHRHSDLRAARPYLLSRRPLGTLGSRTAVVSALIALDLAGLAGGVFVALALRELYTGSTPIIWRGLWSTEIDWFPFLALVVVLVFWRVGLYGPRESRSGFGHVLSSLVLAGALTLAFAVGAGHEFGTYGLVPTAILCTASLVGVLRLCFEAAEERATTLVAARRRILLVGTGQDLDRLRRVVPDGAAVQAVDDAASALGRLSEGRVDEVLVADTELSEGDLVEIVGEAERLGARVRLAPRTTDLLARRGRYVPGRGVPLFELRAPVFTGVEWAVKRAFDVVVSGVVLILGSPLWLLLALAVKLSTRGPVLYRDRRVGLGEQEFWMLKFRTMRPGADGRRPDLEAKNEADGALFKLRDDPRVTPVGRVIRRLSLDEAPQLIHVIRGEMSLVGPRPLPVRDHARLEPWHRKRSLILPGMTGLWQISGRSNLSFDDLVRLDFYYLENWSIWLDIWILLRTIPAVLTRRGAY